MRYYSILLEWLKPKILMTPNADNDVQQQNLSFTTGTATLKDSLEIS